MFSLIAIFIYLLIPLVMLLVHLVRPKFSLQWLLAFLGVIIAWPLVFLSRFRMPQTVSFITWRPETLLPTSPTLLVDNISWPYALALATLALSLILTAATRLEQKPASNDPNSQPAEPPLLADWRAWAGELVLVGFGLVSILAGNLLTLLIGWSALDIAEVFIQLTQLNQSQARERVIVAYSIRAAGIALLLVGEIVIWSEGGLLTLSAISPRASLFLLLAAGLRLGVIPLHLPYMQELPLRQGLGTTLRLVPAAVSLILLVRIATAGVDNSLLPYLLAFTALAALFGGIAWAIARDELTGRPYWILGSASLAVAGALRARPETCLAWGAACLFGGGLVFTASLRRRSLLPVIVLGALSLSALPFTPTWYSTFLYQTSAAENSFVHPVLSTLFSAIFLLGQVFLLTGFLRYSLRLIITPTEDRLEVVERWIGLIYPVGLILLPLAHFLLSIWYRPEIAQVPLMGWAGGPVISGMSLLLLFLGQHLLRPQISAVSSRATSLWMQVFSLNWVYRLIWSIYRLVTRLLDLGTKILEGEGGILWALVLLALIFALLKK